MADREPREGDWECPDCGALVFEGKESCFRCDRRSGKIRKEGDWDCPDCGSLVFAGRETCFKCDRATAKGTNGKGAGRPRQEGDWDCPDCGALVFASRETCFRCDRAAAKGTNGKGAGRPRQEGDWDCHQCGALVFAGRVACFKCGAGGGAKAAVSRGAAAASTPSDAIKTLAKLSKDFRKAWVAYCKLHGDGVNNPADHEEDFISGFADYTASALSTAMDPKAAGKKRAGEAGGDGEAPTKKKVTIKKAVAETIQRLNSSGSLLAPIRLAAVAASLAQLDEVSALKALTMLEEQQEEVEDPNEFLKNQATFLLEGEGAQGAAKEEESYPW